MWKIPPNFQAKSLPDQILSRNPRSYFAVMDIYTPKCSFILLFLGSKLVAVVGSPSVMEHLSFWEPRGGTLPEKVDLSKGGPPTPGTETEKKRFINFADTDSWHDKFPLSLQGSWQWIVKRLVSAGRWIFFCFWSLSWKFKGCSIKISTAFSLEQIEGI